MPTYPIGRRRPIIKQPEEPIDDEEYDSQPVQRTPGRREPIYREPQEPIDDEQYDLPPVQRLQRGREPIYQDQRDPRDYEEENPPRRRLDRVTLIAFVLFFIMLASTIGMAMYSNGTNNDLSNIKWSLHLEENAHNVTNRSLKNMTSLATDRNHTIFLVTQNLTARTNKLTTIWTQLNSTKHVLNDTLSEVNTLMTNNTQLHTQVDYWKNLHPYNVHNPTYAEFKSFYQNDTTNSHPYVNITYTCEEFARDFKANASSKGIRCAFIIIDLNNSNGHCINAVSTTDHGTVYIEPQSDLELAAPVVGQMFQGKLIKSVVTIW